MATELHIDVEDGRFHLVRLTGELDVDTAGRFGTDLESAVTNTSRSVVVLDLAGLTFCDSSGVRTLLGLQRAVAERDRELRIRGVNGTVAEVLRITGVDQVLSSADGDQPQ